MGDRGARGPRAGRARRAGAVPELRYEALVADPAGELRRTCSFAGLEYDEGMLGYVGRTESAKKEHQQRLNEPPRVGVRDWSTEMPLADREAFEAVAGDVLARARLRGDGAGRTMRRRLATYRAKTPPGGPSAP